MKLLILDTTQIQTYVFGSNRLKENIGASYLVARATQDWVTECLATSGASAELLYAGGGNAVIQFHEADGLMQFNRVYSQKCLETAPNLQIVSSHIDFNPQDSLSAAMKDLFKENARNKASRALHLPLQGLGVTVQCHSTRQPATGLVDAGNNIKMPASSEIRAKFAATARSDHNKTPSLADQRLQEMLPLDKLNPTGIPLSYPIEFDNLGRSMQDFSYIAVVHADGDNMSGLMEGILDRHPDPENNEDLIKDIAQFSNHIKEVSQKALRQTLQRVCNLITDKDDKKVIIHSITDPDPLEIAQITLMEDIDNQSYYLPVRPIVFGGDDMTLVCDGRLGLGIATVYLNEFSLEAKKRFGSDQPVTASAGIVITKSHYPFSHAYQLAEDACNNAKNYKRAKFIDKPVPCLDWHFAGSGLSGDLEHIRKMEYEVRYGSLTQRPVTLDASGTDGRNWLAVEKCVDQFQSPQWLMKRNKMKALREALREGKTAVAQFQKKYQQQLPAIFNNNSIHDTGWSDETCCYFDALELADWFIPVSREGSK